MNLDAFTPLDIEIYEPHRADFEDAVPVKATHLRINGMDVLLPEDANITVQGLGSKSECATVTMTVFAHSVKVFRGPAPEPTKESVVDARTASAEELNKALAERGWRLAFNTEPTKPKVNINTYIAIKPPSGVATLPALATIPASAPSVPSPEKLQRISISGPRQSGKTGRAINKMIEHAQAGQRVAYIAGPHEREEAQRRIESIAPDRMIRSYRSHGNQHVSFMDGGKILFIAPTKLACRGFVLDVIVFDGFRPSPELRQEMECALAAAPSPKVYDVFTDWNYHIRRERLV